MDFFDVLGITSIIESLKTKLNLCPKPHLGETMPIKDKFRPRYLDEYIGQDNAKKKVKLLIKRITEIEPVHILLSGRPGTGKTTLAYVIANHAKFKVHYYIANTFTLADLYDFLQLNSKESQPHILFIDEIHSMSRDVIEMLYPILEDFTTIKDIKLRKFVFIGATTDRFTLEKKWSPLVRRLGCKIELSNYTVADIKKILIQYNNFVYKAEIEDKVFDILAQNTRLAPSNAINMLGEYLTCKDMQEVLLANEIIIDGLTDRDIKVLKHLEEVKKPVGEETLSIIAGSSKANYHYVIEPFLIEMGYMTKVARGRILLTKGLELLKRQRIER